MAKGYKANQERLEAVSLFGKEIGKRAGFRCEWCGSKDNLRLWDYRPEKEPEMDSLALLCGRCRELSDGRKPELTELRSIRNALWSNIPAVAEGAARVLASCGDPWAREAIEESLIDEEVKKELLRRETLARKKKD
jgi:protein PhnA